jgi:hypothetical protein
MALWRPVKGYEELYLVSDEGDVIAMPREVDNGRGKYIRKAQLIRPFLRGRDGILYESVCLRKEGVEHRPSVHRLVAEAFVENPDPERFTVVNHIDRNPLNNTAENLEWCDQQYNNEYSHNKQVAQFEDGVKIAVYKNTVYASRMTGIGRSSISNALCGIAKTAGGYEWKHI